MRIRNRITAQSYEKTQSQQTMVITVHTTLVQLDHTTHEAGRVYYFATVSKAMVTCEIK